MNTILKRLLVLPGAVAVLLVMTDLCFAPPQAGPIQPKFEATCGADNTWTSTTNPNGGTARNIAVGQNIDFDDKSTDYDPGETQDGQGAAVDDPIDTHEWWVNDVSKGTNGTLDWSAPAEGEYLVKKKADDDPYVANDDPAFCYMKFQAYDVDYVTVTPDPGYVGVGATLKLTGHAWNDNGTPGNTADDIEVAATFDWSVNPALGTLSPASGSSTTLTAGTTTGSCTVTATHQPSEESGTATVYVVKVVRGANDLWWFDGENAANYDEELTLTAQGTATGSFKWEVTAGAAKVDLNNGGADADTITATDDNTIQVKSTGASAAANDVHIKLTIGAGLRFARTT